MYSTLNNLVEGESLTLTGTGVSAMADKNVGIDKTVEYARKLGVGNVPSVPSLALGSGEVTLESMTAAYGAFANRGLLSTPRFIRRVEDRDGQLLFATDAPFDCEQGRALTRNTIAAVEALASELWPDALSAVASVPDACSSASTSEAR